MLHFDLDWSQLREVANELEASEKQFKAALSRACNRTAATLRKMSGRGLKDELQLRTLAVMRKRLKSIKLKSGQKGLTLWYGLNDLPVSSFKGRAKKTADGATFGGQEFKGGFIARSTVKGKRTVFKRSTGARLPISEQLMPIKDKADVFIEDEIFVQVEEIFWNHFRRDLQARLKYNVGEQ